MTQGEMIKKLRKEQGITQKELANRLGLAPQNIAQWETGKRNPKFETLQKLAAALNIDISNFIDYSEPPEKLGSIEEAQEAFIDTDLEEIIEKLNINGKKKLTVYAEDLSKIPEYRK